MNVPPLALLRSAVLLAGAAAGILLVRALDEGLAREPRPLGAGHAVLGALLAAAVMPGPLLGILVTPRSSEKARGLAVGGSAVTAFAALLGGVLLWRRVSGPAATTAAEWIPLAWCVLALPLAAIDFLRLRVGGEPPPPGPG